MGRAPCCEKMGLKKGPWTSEEDTILITHIKKHGHPNWRALPKQAGLLRCGKSCRLRWINYLRPDIKRGNFTKHEEETIINLHQHLGNRWSAIAARLPGRTDNEIKNVWHTHLKKRAAATTMKKKQNHHIINANNNDKQLAAESSLVIMSPILMQQQASSCSTTTTTDDFSSSIDINDQIVDSSSFDNNFHQIIDESFWTDDTSSSLLSESTSSNLTSDFGAPAAINSSTDGAMEFWYNILDLTTGEASLTLPF